MALRLLPLLEYQYTYDELSGLERTRFDTFGDLMDKGVKIDAHPALVQVLIYYLSHWFGYENWIIKLPFILISLGAVICAYALGYRHFSKNVGLSFSAMMAFSLVFVYHAPIARMYGTGVFLSLGLLYYFFNIFFSGGRGWKNFVLLAVSAWLGALNHHMNALFAGSVYLLGFILIKHTEWKKFLASALLSFLLYAPHVPVTLYQLGIGGIGLEQGGWLEPPRLAELWDFVCMVLGTGYVYLLVFVLALAGWLYDRTTRFTQKQLALLGLFLFNALVIYLYSVLRAPVYQPSVLLFAGTCLPLLMASFIMPFKRRSFVPVFFILTGTLLWQTYVKKDYLNQCVRTVYEYQYQRTAQVENVTAVFFDADRNMNRIYFERYKTFDCKIASDSMVAHNQRLVYTIPGRGEVSALRLYAEYLRDSKTEYLALASAHPIHMAIGQQYFPYLVERTETQAIHYRLYARTRPGDQPVFSEPYRVLDGKASLDQAFIMPMQTDSGTEFPYAQKYRYEDLKLKEGNVLLARALISHAGAAPQAECCLSVTGNSGQNYFYNARAFGDFPEDDEGKSLVLADCFIGRAHKTLREPASVAGYIWNRKKSAFTIINYQLEVHDYWPAKWQLWD